MVPKKNLLTILLGMLLVATLAARAGTRPLLTNFTYNTTCTGEEVEFIITDPINDIDSVKWYFVSPPALPEDSSDLITGAVHTYAAPGTYTVTLKVYRNGVEDVTTVPITIVDRRGVDLGPVNLTICENATHTLTVPYDAAATYTWYFAEDTVTGTNSHTVTEPGTYYVAYNGCKELDSINIFHSPIPDIDLGPDRILCTDELLTLDATAQNATYLWSTGETSPTIVASGATQTYSVSVDVAGCGVYTDDVTITFRGTPYPFSLGRDTLLCPGETVIIDAYRPEATAYQWNGGSRNPQITVNRGGAYSVFVTINGDCDVVDTMEVNYSRLGPFSLGNDTTLCYGDFLVLSADHGTGNYLWQDGSDQATYHVDSSGYYYVQVQIGRCMESDTIRVDFQDSLRVSLGEDSTLCIGETLQLVPRGAGNNFKWQDSTATATFLVTQPGIYAIVAQNVCNRATDSVNIYYQNCDCTVFLPTAFSPNGDGRNDYFRPVYRCQIGQYKLSIYNRWGEFIFHTTDPRVGWNGHYNGSPAAMATYVWTLEYIDELNLKKYHKTGTITLIR